MTRPTPVRKYENNSKLTFASQSTENKIPQSLYSLKKNDQINIVRSTIS